MGQIWNLLKKMLMTIPGTSILGHILYAMKTHPPYTYPKAHITTLQPIAIAEKIAMQFMAIASLHYN